MFCQMEPKGEQRQVHDVCIVSNALCQKTHKWLSRYESINQPAEILLILQQLMNKEVINA